METNQADHQKIWLVQALLFVCIAASHVYTATDLIGNVRTRNGSFIPTSSRFTVCCPSIWQNRLTSALSLYASRTQRHFHAMANGHPLVTTLLAHREMRIAIELQDVVRQSFRSQSRGPVCIISFI